MEAGRGKGVRRRDEAQWKKTKETERERETDRERERQRERQRERETERDRERQRERGCYTRRTAVNRNRGGNGKERRK